MPKIKIVGTLMKKDTGSGQVTFLDRVLGASTQNPNVPFSPSQPCLNMNTASRQIEVLQRVSRSTFTYAAGNPPVFTLDAANSFNTWFVEPYNETMYVWTSKPCYIHIYADIPNSLAANHYLHAKSVTTGNVFSEITMQDAGNDSGWPQYFYNPSESAFRDFANGEKVQFDNYIKRRGDSGSSEAWLKLKLRWNGGTNAPTVVSAEPTDKWSTDTAFSIYYSGAGGVWYINYSENRHPYDTSVYTVGYYTPLMIEVGGTSFKYLNYHGVGEISGVMPNRILFYPFDVSLLHNACSTQAEYQATLPAAGDTCTITILYRHHHPDPI